MIPPDPTPNEPTTGYHGAANDEGKTRDQRGPARERSEPNQHRLSPWMILIKPVELAPSLIPILIAVFLTGRASPLIGLIVAAVGIPLIAVVPWLTTRYTVTDERVTVHSGIITRKTASAPRDRIRSVELSATLAHRVLKLSKVRIGTGGDSASTVVELNAIPTVAAAALRAELLSHPTVSDASNRTAPNSAAPHSTTPTDAPPIPTSSTELIRFRLSWLRFAPFSLAGFAAAGAIVGVGAQLTNDLDLGERGARAASGVADNVADAPIAIIVLLAVAVVVVVATVLSLAGYLLSYWNFSVVRELTPSGRSLHITRGLLTTNSTSLDERRVHGVALAEPTLMRPVHGAKLTAIATGTDKHPLLLPPAPHADAVRLAEQVSGDAAELNRALRPHGSAARRRRWTWAGVAGVPLVAAAAIVVAFAPSWWPVLAAAIVVAVGSAALGEVRYRHLGTSLTPTSVVFAPPSVARQRRVLHREGVIGAVIRQSFFQRRAGVCTVIVATAAGSEGYAAVDLADVDAQLFVAELLPHS